MIRSDDPIRSDDLIQVLQTPFERNDLYFIPNDVSHTSERNGLTAELDFIFIPTLQKQSGHQN